MTWPVVVAGTLSAGALLAAGAARRGFHRRIEGLERSLGKASAAAARKLPPEVLALGQRCGVPASGPGRLVRLTQRGAMWRTPNAKALAFTARQTIAVAEVGFVWRALFPLGAGTSLEVIDYAANGEAGLEGRLGGTLRVLRVSDSDAAYRGEAMRYLAELMWNPDALLFNSRLDWRVLGARTLGVATGAGGRRSEVRLLLDEAGDVARVEADDRPRLVGDASIPTPWFGRGTDYQRLGGRRLPMKGEVGWVLDGAEFVYWRGQIESWSLEPSGREVEAS